MKRRVRVALFAIPALLAMAVLGCYDPSASPKPGGPASAPSVRAAGADATGAAAAAATQLAEGTKSIVLAVPGMT
jgi:hypothetical protein